HKRRERHGHFLSQVLPTWNPLLQAFHNGADGFPTHRARPACRDRSEPAYRYADALGTGTDSETKQPNTRKTFMNPDDMSGLDELLLDSTLAGIEEDAPPSQIETVLRSIASAIADADPIRRAVVREALIRRLRRVGVSCPVTLTNIAFGTEKQN